MRTVHFYALAGVANIHVGTSVWPNKRRRWRFLILGLPNPFVIGIVLSPVDTFVLVAGSDFGGETASLVCGVGVLSGAELNSHILDVDDRFGCGVGIVFHQPIVFSFQVLRFGP